MSDSQAEGPRIRLNPLLMQTHFIYESQAPLVEIEKALEFERALREGFAITLYTSKLTTMPNYITVNTRIHRQVGRRSSFYPTGHVKATLWEDPTGRVYIEGVAQAEAISFYGWMIVMLILGFFALVGSSLWTILPLLAVAGLTLFFIVTFYQDRNKILKIVQMRFSNVENLRADKLKNEDHF